LASQEFQYISDIMKDFYAPVIVNQTYKKAPFWAQVKKLTKGVYGKRIVIPVQTAFTEAVGARVANNYNLPSAQKNSYDQAYITIKRNYGRVKVDGFSIESTKGKGGWIDVMAAETKGVANAFALDLDRQSLGRGDGVLGHVASVSGSDITVDNPFGITEASTARLFRNGMVLDGYDYDNDTQHVDSLTISSIASNVLTMSASTGISSLADGDYLVREDSYSATAANQGEIMGLDGIVDTANAPGDSLFEGIDADSESTWQSTVDTTSQVISESVLQSMLDSIEKITDGDTVNLALTTYDLRNKLIEIMQADRMIQTMDLVAGWKAIKYVGGNISLPITVHKNCPTSYFYMVALPHIKFYTLKKLVWDNKGGGVVKPVAGEDAYESWFKLYGNMGCDCRNSMGKFTALSTS